jgi:hypothetical protein
VMTRPGSIRRRPLFLGGLRRSAAVALLAAAAVTLSSAPVGANGGGGGTSKPSDPRATFHSGNATTCSDVSFGSDTQVGSDNGNGSDNNVAGVVKANAGSINPGQGQELDVSITGANVVIDAVVVKGGDGYNVYTNQAFLPPTLPPDQHYISPFTGGGGDWGGGGGNIPDISHWFICYNTSGGAVPVGSIGIIGGTVLLAAGLGVVTWRSRRRRLAATPS